MSTSSTPTWYPLDARVCAIWHATVDLPTPPFPDSTSTTWDTLERAARMSAASRCWAKTASGELNLPELQSPWLGQPSHADAFPASFDAGPTQPSLASSGLPASGLSLADM